MSLNPADAAPCFVQLEDLIDVPAGTVVGRHYRTGRGVKIAWRDGRITRISPRRALAGDPWIAPALVDLQVNGYGGVDFQDRAITAGDLRRAIAALRRDGCARILATLTSCPWSALLKKLSRLKAMRNASPGLRRAIVGWHIEGPFISGEAGFVGAHDLGAVCDPTAAAIDQLKAIVREDPTLLTLAPERNGAIAAIKRARAHGMIVSLGHTNASRGQIAAAIAAGAKAFTHLGNGCPQQLDRHDNILWRVLDRKDGDLTVGLIPDTHHVSPQEFRLFHRLIGRDRIYWTTDAMAGAGAPPGRYTIGKQRLQVGEDRVVRCPGRDSFAGSALEPLRGVRLGAEMLGRRWNDVWDHFSTIPAVLLGLPYGLAPGADAVFCLLRE